MVRSCFRVGWLSLCLPSAPVHNLIIRLPVHRLELIRRRCGPSHERLGGRCSGSRGTGAQPLWSRVGRGGGLRPCVGGSRGLRLWSWVRLGRRLWSWDGGGVASPRDKVEILLSHHKVSRPLPLRCRCRRWAILLGFLQCSGHVERRRRVDARERPRLILCLGNKLGRAVRSCDVGPHLGEWVGCSCIRVHRPLHQSLARRPQRLQQLRPSEPRATG
mmetsp:Transcript_57715/g.135980  ORF Transcript_57715/g.135980 Transcript_57715/m.135980 type:complete len:217 (-) Transcript_57715:1228-1878(-)